MAPLGSGRERPFPPKGKTTFGEVAHSFPTHAGPAAKRHSHMTFAQQNHYPESSCTIHDKVACSRDRERGEAITRHNSSSALTSTPRHVAGASGTPRSRSESPRQRRPRSVPGTPRGRQSTQILSSSAPLPIGTTKSLLGHETPSQSFGNACGCGRNGFALSGSSNGALGASGGSLDFGGRSSSTCCGERGQGTHLDLRHSHSGFATSGYTYSSGEHASADVDHRRLVDTRSDGQPNLRTPALSPGSPKCRCNTGTCRCFSLGGTACGDGNSRIGNLGSSSCVSGGHYRHGGPRGGGGYCGSNVGNSRRFGGSDTATCNRSRDCTCGCNRSGSPRNRGIGAASGREKISGIDGGFDGYTRGQDACCSNRGGSPQHLSSASCGWGRNAGATSLCGGCKRRHTACSCNRAGISFGAGSGSSGCGRCRDICTCNTASSPRHVGGGAGRSPVGGGGIGSHGGCLGSCPGGGDSALCHYNGLANSASDVGVVRSGSLGIRGGGCCDGSGHPRESAIEPPVAHGGARTASFLRLNIFLLRTHITSLISALTEDGWLEAWEKDRLCRLAKQDSPTWASTFLRVYTSFMETEDVPSFVSNLRNHIQLS
eukprot:TRINITY_DN9415_c0_g2_i1.p1 TRINITY_DN9415_c0_g2~~TRINITY_DN9415_c0_g2_i1.p1  ORF type:complete len:624 (-),score=59.32 TRINITY_DN9415_c0_g2_i1:123-1922(-)